MSKDESFQGLPFGSFLTVLREAGFFISVRDITEFTTIFQQLLEPVAMTPEVQKSKREELKLLLAPVICRNPTEQTKFYQLFDDFFIKQKTEPAQQEVGMKTKGRKYFLYAVLCVGVLIALFLVLGRGPAPIVETDLYLNLSTPEDCLWVNHPIQLSAVMRNEGRPDTPVWSFGDNTPLTKAAGVTHVFKECGKYPVRLLKRAGGADSANVYDTLDLAVFPAGLLSQRGYQDLMVGDTARIVAEALDSVFRRGKASWIVTNQGDQKQRRFPFTDTVLNYTCSKEGAYTVTLVPGGASCQLGPSFSFSVADPQNAVLSVTASGPVAPSKVRAAIGLLIVLLVVFICCTAIAIYTGTRKRKLLLSGSPPPVNPPGMEQPLEMPMNSRNARITRLQDQSRVSALLLQRIESDTTYLNLPKTIRRSIDNQGLFVPQYSRRYKDRNYLILIDGAGTAGSQYTHLFGYLARTFLRDNVDLSYYYYFDKPDVLYGENRSIPIYLKDVADKHYGATLLIFSNGRSLIDPSLPTIRWSIKKLFDGWMKKLLVTPVPARDWDVNEKILSAYFSVLPADISGLLNLVKYINEDLPGSNSPRTRDWETYTVESISIRNIRELREYLIDEDLVQWVCALSVYNRLRWEVIIELGKTILTQAGAIAKLNYTNLLKIARIRWIEAGVFPEAMRFALLRALEVSNEMIARKALLALFSESDNVVGPESFSYNEKMAQRYTDSFILYAGNSANREQYREDADKFIALWDSGRVADSSLSHYLSNPKHEWETPLDYPDGKKSKVNIGEYIRKTVPRRRRVLLYPAIVLAVLALVLLVALIRYPGQVDRLPVNRYLHLVRVQQESVESLITMTNDSCTSKYVDTANSVLHITYTGDTTPTVYSARMLLTEPQKVSLQSGHLSFTLSNLRGDVSGGFESDTLYQHYNVSIAGPFCNTRRTAVSPATVFIQYDPVLNRNAVEKLRVCLASSNFNAPGLQGIKLSYPRDNCIRYFNDSMKTVAENLKAVLKSCAQLDFRVERSGLRKRTDSLEVWINSLGVAAVAACPLVGIDQVAGVRQDIPYYSTDVKNQLQLSKLTIATMSSIYNLSIRNCQGQYTLYLKPWVAPVQAQINAPVTSGKPDSVRITITKGKTIHVNPGSRSVAAGDYFPSPFRSDQPIALTGIDPADIGYYQMGSNGGYCKITRDSIYFIDQNGSPYSSYKISLGSSYVSGVARVYDLSPVTFLAIMLTNRGKFVCQFRGSGGTAATPAFRDDFVLLSPQLPPSATRLSGTVQTAAPKLNGFDVNQVLSAAQAQTFKKAGYDFCIRYIPRTSNLSAGNLTNAEAQDILNAGLALMVVQHSALPGWKPSAELGSLYGDYAVYSGRSIGLPKGMNVWCDLEGVAPGTPAADVIAYCEAWYSAVSKAGYVPGLFVGYDVGLNSAELSQLPFQHFWQMYNGPQGPRRGFQLVQETQRYLAGIAFDPDVTQFDNVGEGVLWVKK